MPDNRQQGLWCDMLDSARSIQGYLRGVSREEFLGNPEKQDAVLRRLEIIGEAARRLDAESQAVLHELPLREIRGMRNIIAHDYGDVDLDLVWETCAGDMERMVNVLSRVIDPENLPPGV